MTTSPLAHRIARRLAHNLLVSLALAVVVIFSLAHAEKESINHQPTQGSAASLVAANECGNNVSDPTHAVVTVDNVTRYVGQHLTDKAIEQVMFGVDHGLTVHAFCP